MSAPSRPVIDVCLVATVPYSLTVFMTPHVKTLSRAYRVTLVANGSAEELSGLLGGSVSFQKVAIARDISIVDDVKAVISLWKLFRHRRFQIVHSITPKGGLLSMIAACVAGVPIRLHWFTGQVWATKSAVSRWLLKTLDRLLVLCATHVLADSPAQRDFLVEEGVLKRSDVVVLGHGSVCGVDTERFRPNSVKGSRIRVAVGIPDDGVVALYLGRLNREKGLVDLAGAFTLAARERADLHLLIVGPDEARVRESVIDTLSEVAGRAHFVDYTSEPEAYMAAADMFVLPSRREGFGSSVIEAAACEVPTIGTSIYGLSDALVDGESGILVPVGDVSALSSAMVRLATNPDERHAMGKAARIRVEQRFKQEHLTAALIDFYQKLLDSEGGSR